MLLNRVRSPASSRPAVPRQQQRCWLPAVSGRAACVAVAGDMPGSPQLVLTVDRSGRGDHRSIQDAIDAAPADDSAGGSVVIRIKPGEYREKVVVGKPRITLLGTNAGSTVVTWNDPSVAAASAASPSSTVSVLASDFIAKRLTFQNTFGSSGPAVALRVAGDRAAFYGCRFLSSQDTLLDDTGRHYYRGCYVEGSTDLVVGNGKALFDKCHLHSTSPVGGAGAFTAHQRSSESEDTGFSFVGCRLTGLGVATSILGRPRGPCSRVVFALSYMSSTVRPEGWWDDDDDCSDDPAKRRCRTAFYGQYQCYGEGSKTDGRVAWSHDLSQAEAAPFITKVWVGGQEWLR